MCAGTADAFAYFVLPCLSLGCFTLLLCLCMHSMLVHLSIGLFTALELTCLLLRRLLGKFARVDLTGCASTADPDVLCCAVLRMLLHCTVLV